MSDKKFELGDYVEVKDRIKLLYELYGQARLVTEEVTLTNEPDGKPRVMVKALAYRTPEDPHPGVGYSWLELPGRTPYTNGSELENAETSAWGRAIASLGILLDKSIASQQEIQNKEGSAAGDVVDNGTNDGSLIGTVAKGKPPVDYELRQEATKGPMAGFKLAQGRKGLQVLAYGNLASVLQPLLEKLEGQRVSVWGQVVMVDWDREGQKMPPYKRLILGRIKTADWELPGGIVGAESEGPDEAESEPLGLVDDDLTDVPDELWAVPA